MTAAAEKVCAQCESEPAMPRYRLCVSCQRQRSTEKQRARRRIGYPSRTCRTCGDGLSPTAPAQQRLCGPCSAADRWGIVHTVHILHRDADPVQPTVATSHGVAQVECVHCGSRSIKSDDLGPRCLACGRAAKEVRHATD